MGFGFWFFVLFLNQMKVQNSTQYSSHTESKVLLLKNGEGQELVETSRSLAPGLGIAILSHQVPQGSFSPCKDLSSG